MSPRWGELVCMLGVLFYRYFTSIEVRIDYNLLLELEASGMTEIFQKPC